MPSYGTICVIVMIYAWLLKYFRFCFALLTKDDLDFYFLFVYRVLCCIFQLFSGLEFVLYYLSVSVLIFFNCSVGKIIAFMIFVYNCWHFDFFYFCMLFWHGNYAKLKERGMHVYKNHYVCLSLYKFVSFCCFRWTLL